MVSKYIFGTPFETEAVVLDVQTADGSLTHFELENDSFIYHLTDDAIVYGLGEQVRGINKRGWEYISWNYDNPHHQEDTRSLYGSHNFIIVSNSNGDSFGAFFDYPGKITWDIGYTQRDVMRITPATLDLKIYIITGNNEKDIVNQFRSIIGESYIPPMWAFGYGQSRWGYKDEADIRTVAETYQKLGIPLESIYMDIDYMDSYKDFTINKERFKDLQALTQDMMNQGIHLVPIIDAGVKIEPGYETYEEGVRLGYFCKDKDGNDFVGAVWPGRVHFPDFLNPEARKWFGHKYKALTDLGIDGFWNDMNEPAIFYTEDRLQDAMNKIDGLRGSNIGIDDYFDMTGTIGGLNGNEGDYDKFYHNVDGKLINHSRVHNLYGMNMTRAASEALRELEPDKQILFFSRASYIGAHRYGGIWQGDNKSWWSHILQSMQQLPALNMAGFMFIGPDMGGFGCDTTEDLMMRWLQYSMFTPLFRNHSCNGTRFQELYHFSNVDELGEMIKIRYSLIPYLHSVFMTAVTNNEMMFRPLAFDFTSDEIARDVDDQLLLGDNLMIAPIYKQNARGRYVYLPEEMMLIRMSRWNDYDTEILDKGHHFVKAELNELIFFIRQGKSIPVYEPAQNTGMINYSTKRMLGY